MGAKFAEICQDQAHLFGALLRGQLPIALQVSTQAKQDGGIKAGLLEQGLCFVYPAGDKCLQPATKDGLVLVVGALFML